MLKKVAIVMGSKTDQPVAEKAEGILKEFSISFETLVISAHRNPNKIRTFCKNAIDNQFGVVIAIAGLAAHLPGVIASMTTLPVIGVPAESGSFQGVDALYSIVEMPAGVPVACVGIGNSKNAALLAVQILATGENTLHEALKKYRKRFGDDES